jgi:hypothetical protein
MGQLLLRSLIRVKCRFSTVLRQDLAVAGKPFCSASRALASRAATDPHHSSHVIVGPVVTVSSKPLPFGCMYLKLLMFFVMPGLSKGCAEM